MQAKAQSCESVKSDLRIFANHAVTMRRAGFAVLPANGKKPLRGSFNKWRYAPGEKVVGEWATKTPDADIVIVPGLSRHRRGGGTLVMLDGDDQNACGQSIERFGDTPGKVNTRRGKHFYFRHDGPGLGRISSLRKYGFNIDVKHGQLGAGIVVAPPSRHEKDRSFQYEWDGCDETVIRDLPKFPIKVLEAILNRGIVVPTGTQAELKAKAGFNGGSRHLELNRYLVGRGAYLGAFELIALGQQWNESLPDGIDKLEERAVVQAAQIVWKDFQSGKLHPWQGQASVVRTDHSEVMKLLVASPTDGAHAVTMLMALRIHHAARCLRGETFAINQVAMVESGTLPGFTRVRIEKCRDLLIKCGFLKLASPGCNSKDGRSPAQYQLAL